MKVIILFCYIFVLFLSVSIGMTINHAINIPGSQYIISLDGQSFSVFTMGLNKQYLGRSGVHVTLVHDGLQIDSDGCLIEEFRSRSMNLENYVFQLTYSAVDNRSVIRVGLIDYNGLISDLIPVPLREGSRLTVGINANHLYMRHPHAVNGIYIGGPVTIHRIALIKSHPSYTEFQLIDNFHSRAIPRSDPSVYFQGKPKVAEELHHQGSCSTSGANVATSICNKVRDSTCGIHVQGKAKVVEEGICHKGHSSTSSANVPAAICNEVNDSKCGICFDDISLNEVGSSTQTMLPGLLLNPCNHAYCRECLEQYIVTAVMDQTYRFPLKCPQPECSNALSPDNEVVNSLLPGTDVMTKYMLMHITATELTIKCPHPNCGELNILDPSILNGKCQSDAPEFPKCQCAWCTGTMCFNCQVPWHKGLTCLQYKLSQDSNASEQAVIQLGIDNKWRRCPECGAMIEHTEGCYHMTCRLCKYEFWYDCGHQWTSYNPCPCWKKVDNVNM